MTLFSYIMLFLLCTNSDWILLVFIMIIYFSIWIAPFEFQQGEDYGIVFVHVLVARMSLLFYIVIAFNNVVILIDKTYTFFSYFLN